MSRITTIILWFNTTYCGDNLTLAIHFLAMLSKVNNIGIMGNNNNIGWDQQYLPRDAAKNKIS